MEIVFFHRKTVEGVMSIQETFKPLIKKMSESNEVKVYSVPYYGANPINILKNILYIRKHSSKTGINHITGDIHYGILGLIGRKSVLTIHDDYAMRQARKNPVEKVLKWLFWFYLPIKIAKAPVCITPTTLDNIKKYCNSKKLRVITHHVAPVFDTKTRGLINKEKPHFLQIGTAGNKNLETTLEVLKGMKCHLTVLKKMSPKQKQIAEEYGIEYENKWDLPYNEVLQEYENCDVVLFPSLYEGLGVPIIEAQAAGKPVISSNRMPMIWVAGGAAVLLNDPLDVEEYKNAINKVLLNDDFRKDVILKGYQNVERFSLESSVNNYMKLYKEIR